MTLRNKQYLTQGDFSKKGREPSDHLKMPECLYDRVFLFLRRLRRRHIHLVHIDFYADVILSLRKFGQKTYRLHMCLHYDLSTDFPDVHYYLRTHFRRSFYSSDQTLF